MEDREHHVLLAEPAGNVKNALSGSALQVASQGGLVVARRPHMRRSHTALLKKTLAHFFHVSDYAARELSCSSVPLSAASFTEACSA
jgi:hypothetical protein